MIAIREDIFAYYFYFMQERMKLFWNKYYHKTNTIIEDDILRTYKFTNVYRVCDRISQYLIKNVIYKDNGTKLNEVDVLLRIIIFKVFNKIETWEYLEDRVGPIKVNNFDIEKIDRVLTVLKEKSPIFSNAYMMTGTHSKYNHLKYKHHKWLMMIKEELLQKKIFIKILNAKSLSEVYSLLRNCSFLGDFLAYQYAIDLNYSSFINFNENSFVRAGIGAIRGIKKCFISLDNSTYEDAIKYTQDNFIDFQRKFGFTEFKNLFGRVPTLIDIQNCFCETDKYLRARIPELQVDNIRIKQKYRESGKPIEFFFPPKWELNMNMGNEYNVCR